MIDREISITLGVLALAVSVGSPFASAGEHDGEKFLVKKGAKLQLVARLEARDEQLGELLPTGRIWVISETGNWSTYKYELKKGKPILVEGSTQSGTLDETELVTLAAGLERHGLERLPAELGEKPNEENYDPGAYSYHIRFGDKSTAAYGLRPRRGSRDIQKVIMQSIPKGDDKQIWERFASLAHLIEETCRPDKAR